MALKAGTVSNFSNSMAAAIEQAFQTEWNTHKDIELGDAGEEDRKILFAAIAQGVVEYLSDNINSSLQIEVEVKQDNDNITSSNTSTTVTQQSGSSNRVVSNGEATNIELLIE